MKSASKSRTRSGLTLREQAVAQDTANTTPPPGAALSCSHTDIVITPFILSVILTCVSSCFFVFSLLNTVPLCDRSYVSMVKVDIQQRLLGLSSSLFSLQGQVREDWVYLPSVLLFIAKNFFHVTILTVR